MVYLPAEACYELPEREAMSSATTETRTTKSSRAPFVRDVRETVVLHDVSWSFYERFLKETEEKSKVRHAYDDGELELMTPAQFYHENSKKLVARMIETMCDEFSLPLASAGSLLLKRKQLRKGIEPDECYYIANAEKVRGRRRVHQGQQPPPDLALEIDDTSTSLDRMSIYAALGVPELWRLTLGGLKLYLLRQGRYREVKESPHFPGMHADELNRFLRQAQGHDETQWIRAFRSRIREIVEAGESD